MFIHEYGDSGAPIILALHPMGLTGENLHDAMAPRLKGDYCIISPDEGGHGRSGPYTTLGEEVAVLKEYLLGRGYTDIRLLYGASMGVTAAYELLKDPAFRFEKIWFDGGGFSSWAPTFDGRLAPVVRAVLSRYRKDPDIIEKSFAKNYGPAFAKIMRQNFITLRDDDIIRIINAYSHMKMVRLPRKVQERMHLEWGTGDMNYKNSRSAVKKYFPRAEAILRIGYGHCGYMAFHTGRYVREIEEFINR